MGCHRNQKQNKTKNSKIYNKTKIKNKIKMFATTFQSCNRRKMSLKSENKHLESVDDEDRNYLLDWFQICFGYIGIQLKPINFSKKLLIWNILIIIIINCYYKILVSQLYWDNNVMKNSSKINKNLNNFMSLIGGYYLQISIIINPIIFLSIGSSINHLMSDKIFTRIYNSRQKSWNINHMAIINRKISRNLSPILSIVIISSIIDIIVLFMWFQNYDLNFLRSFISSLTTWLYLGYLIQLDSNSIRKFQFIIEKFINENLFKCCKHNNNNDNNCCCCCCSKQQQKNNIIFCQQKQRLIECYRLYRHDFQMNLFKLCSIDCNFLLQSFLFILIFVVISLQT
ncbi:uncharacterized protein LOC142645264 isoform X3 [Dermatophagoides pteronyssinus]|uniref:uncharacterized protein LOC142645264 isoform X3 n=1 Tax=Dermatophagoides pteronyssinus TaxID=6956 RepID=UPI003F662B9B